MSLAGMEVYWHSDSNNLTLKKAKAKNIDDQPLQAAAEGHCWLQSAPNPSKSEIHKECLWSCMTKPLLFALQARQPLCC